MDGQEHTIDADTALDIHVQISRKDALGRKKAERKGLAIPSRCFLVLDSGKKMVTGSLNANEKYTFAVLGVGKL
jgi:hypothetical protein